MPGSLFEDLRDRIQRKEAVIVVGAGVSMRTTDGAPCASWTGLLKHGALRCVELNPGLRANWLPNVDFQIDSGDTDEMISAAERITSKLGSKSGGEYRLWLREALETLPIQKNDVLNSLASLAKHGVVLATTNYDPLLERATGLPGVTWKDTADVERVLRGDFRAILHLHGSYEHPESVVLGIRSYEETLGSGHAQTVLRSLALLRTLVFVGCGAGLEDPNFGRLLEWTGQVFEGSEYRRFRLARGAKERDELQHEHPPEQRLFVLSYGEQYHDLAPYLLSLLPASSAPAPLPATGLPGKPRCFGRDDTVRAAVASLLAAELKPLPLLGPPGMGKSTVALTALYDPQVVKRFGPRRYFVRCDAAKTAAAVWAAIGQELGVVAAPDMVPLVLAELGRAPVALVLDNFETPWEAGCLPVEDVLGRIASVDGVAAIVALRGTIRPGGVDFLESSELKPLGLLAAQQAFLAIAGTRFSRDPLLDAFLRMVDCVPLAITLLAHVAESESELQSVRERWKQSKTELLQRAGGKTAQTNLELSFELSIAGPRMNDDARQLLRVVALLPNGIVTGDRTAAMVRGGEAASILKATGLAYEEAGRLRLLAPVREYVLRKYPAGEEEVRPLMDVYLMRLRENGRKAGRSGGKEAIEMLAPEAANLEEMLLRAVAVSRSDLREAMSSWGEFSQFSGLGTSLPLVRWSEGARSSGRVADLAAGLHAQGDIALSRSDHDTARRRFEEALPLYRQVGAVLGDANCIYSLGDIALRRSDHDTARARFEEALPLYRQVGAVLGEANCIRGLGDIALQRSDHDTARARYQEALPLYRQVGAGLGEANCIQGLGDIALGRSDHDTARARYQEALPLYRQVGSVLGEANCIKSLGDIALRRSDHDTARARYQEALPLYRQVGDVLGEANCIRGLGDIALRRSDHDTARTRYQEALSLYERIQEPYSIGFAHLRLGRLCEKGSRRDAHRAAAADAWRSIGREDLLGRLKELDE